MDFNDRKKRILQVIVEDFILTNTPVGSRTISKSSGLGVSSATIRNEMADLEEMGYLIQPHVSAGRVPSDKAYRLYVDALLTRDCARMSAKASAGILPPACTIWRTSSPCARRRSAT